MQGKELAEGTKQPVEWLPKILAMKLRSISLCGEDVGAPRCRAEPPGESARVSLKRMDLPVEKTSEHQLSTHPCQPALV